MIELRRFQHSLATGRSKAFDFERASLILLAKLQNHGAIAISYARPGDRFDPCPPRSKAIVQQGVNHYG
jgi:hypothetical protein